MKAKSRIRKLVAAATIMTAAAGLTAFTAGSAFAITAAPAQFQGGWATVCNSHGCLLDRGHGYRVTLEAGGGTLFYMSASIVDGRQAWSICTGEAVQGGPEPDCLEPSPSNHYVYDESDAFDSSETWLSYSNGALKNDYDGLNMTAPSAGGYVYVGGGPPNGSNEWSS
jgi:hypothetical protein